MLVPKNIATAIRLPEHLAERAGAEEVLAADDEEFGGFNVYATWTECGDSFEVGERLRCFSPYDYGKVADLVSVARTGTIAVDAQTMARIGEKRCRPAKKRRRGRSEDRDEIAGDRARYEEV